MFLESQMMSKRRCLSGRDYVQGHVNVAACCFGVRADLVCGVGDFCRDGLIQTWSAQRQACLEEVSVAGLAKVDFDIDGHIGGKLDVALFGSQTDGGDVAGRPGTGKQLLGFGCGWVPLNS